MNQVDTNLPVTEDIYLTTPLTGTNLLEASAGTGKTYTVALLYLRAVLGMGTVNDKPLDLKEILVVTFTNAATEELISRIRHRIKEALDALHMESKDVPLKTVLNEALKVRDKAEIKKLLKTALSQISFAKISTIHSFCADVIQSVAIDAALPLELSLTTDQQQIELPITDLWRRNMESDDSILKEVDHSFDDHNNIYKISIQKDINTFEKGECEYDESKFNEIIAAHKHLPGRKELESAFESYENIFTSGAKLSGNDLTKKLDALYAINDDAKSLKCGAIKNLSIDVILKGMKKKGVDEQQKQDFINGLKKIELFRLANEYSTINGNKVLRFRNITFFEKNHQWLKQRIKQNEELTSEVYADRLIQIAADISSIKSVAQQIRQKMPLAIIDEFQDTDAFQFQLFNNIYKGSDCGLVMVGDPKQAIYSFRGGDIYAYLKAKTSATNNKNLPDNYRASKQLVAGVNSIFSQPSEPDHPNYSKGAFNHSQINFIPVQSKSEESLLQIKTTAGVKPLNAIQGIYKSENQNLEMNAAAMKQTIVQDCAEYVERLLKLSASGQCFTDEKMKKSLKLSDITFLVNSHNQAKLLKSALSERGIPSLTQSRESIYHEPEAYDIWVILQSLMDPSDFNQFQAAMMVNVNFLNYKQVAKIIDDEQTLQQWIEYWHELSTDLAEKGPMLALLKWFKAVGASLQFALTENDRQATNVMQLLELLQEQFAKLGAGQKLLNHLEQSILDTSVDDEKTLRLESDEDRVKIVTIHASKGLEYKVVFVPFAWSHSIYDRDKLIVAHDGQGNQVAGFSADIKKLKEKELKDEKLRQLYVALTRASKHLVLYFIDNGTTPKNNPIQPSSNYNDSPLGWYFPTQSNLDSVETAFHSFQKVLNPVNQGCVSLRDIPLAESQMATDLSVTQPNSQQRKQVKKFTGSIDRYLGVSSFSAITRGYHSVAKGRDDDDDLFEAIKELAAQTATNRHTLAKGSHVGNALHNVLEYTDFKYWNQSGLDAAKQQLQHLLNTELKANGVIRNQQDFHSILSEYQQWMTEVIQSPFHPTQSSEAALALKDLKHWLPELEFTFNLADGFNKSKLRKLLEEHGYHLTGLKGHSIHGMLTGAIDLVFEHEGRYYLADYKSNYLGTGYHAYEADALAINNDEKAYTLQYLIYSLALHKHLAARLPDYDYKTHFGGAYYLYLRGMHPDDQHQGKGVFFHQPSFSVISMLDQYLCIPSAEKNEVLA